VGHRVTIGSGSAFEARLGYARAVVADGHVYVSGTAPVMADGGDPPADAYGQAKRCLEIIEAALHEAGASFADVVRTRIYVTDPALIDEVGRAHAEAFADVRPACTGVVVQLLDPRWLVELEVDALLP
jgi:enamine deaminase RidA (YjgF/YER057c/UK114 family)